MNHSAFAITNECLLQRIPDVDSTRLTSASASPIWIDIPQRNQGLLEDLFGKLGLHSLAIEACLEETPSARFEVYDSSLFLGLPILTDWEDGRRIFLSILCLPGKLITIHNEPIPALNGIMAQFEATMHFHTAGTSSVLYQIFDHIVDHDVLLSLQARRGIDQAEAALDEESTSDLPDESNSIKRRLVLLEGILEDQHHCISALKSVESDAFTVDGLQDYFRDAVKNLEHAMRSVDRLSDRLSAMQQHYLLKLQDKVNKRLQVLTVVSSVFMPLMLVTGIYGMNFRRMPELSWKYGYPAALVLMASEAALLFWIFYKKGWFK